MMPAAKHFDPVLGVDIHIIQPPGPVPPVPVPHPFIGFLFDPFDYVPILGATVMVNGVPRAIAGTQGRTVPGVHFPIGGTFVKPPANECEMFMGSSTVDFDGDAASYMALPALSCQCIGMVAPFRPKKKGKIKSLVAPFSVVLPIPLGPPVLIGGPPTISLMALGMKLGMAALGKALKKLSKTKAFKKFKNKFKKKKPGTNKACGRPGEPVDVVSGANVDDFVDYELPGSIVFRWKRYYDSSQSHIDGPVGRGFRHEYQRTLRHAGDRFEYVNQEGEGIEFPLPENGRPVAHDGFLLEPLGEHIYRLYETGNPAMEFRVESDGRPGRLLRLKINEHWMEFGYDGAGLLSGIHDSLGRSIRVNHDRSGHIIGLELLDPGSNHWRSIAAYGYNARGDLLTWRDALGYVAQYAYDAAGRMIRKTDRRGYSYHYEYDEQGRCIHTFGDDGLYDVRFEYLKLDRCTIATWADGGRFRYYYDEDGTLTRIVDPYGGIRVFVTDDEGRVVEDVHPSGAVTRLLYNEWGGHTSRIDPFGYSTPPVDIQPHPRNPLAHRMPANPLEWEFGRFSYALALRRPKPLSEKYDAAWRLLERVESQGIRERFAYDPNGNVIGRQDRDGGIWRFEFKSWNLLGRSTNPLGHSVSYDYSLREQVTRIADPAGNISEYIYDLKDRLIEVRRHGVIRERYEYDQADNLVRKYDGDGNVLLAFKPGPAGLIAERQLNTGDTHRFEYNGQGRCTRATAPGVDVRLGWQGRQCTADLRNGKGVQAEFAGIFLTKLVVFERFVTSYRHARQELIVRDPLGGEHRFAVASGRLIQKQLSNGVQEIIRYDTEGRCTLKSATHPLAAAEAWRREYFYSAEGDLVRVEDNRRGVVHYEYDRAHRLTREYSPDRLAHVYEYDPAGNLLRQPGLDGVSIAEGNRLSTANGDRFHYNARNHIARRSGPSGSTQFEYDSWDALIRISGSEIEWRAAYDPLGRRIAAQTANTRCEYYWYGDRLAAEVLANGSFRVYVYVDDWALVPFMFIDYESPHADPSSGRRYFLHTNQIGVPLRVDDDHAGVVWSATVDPYGTTRIAPESSIELNLRFPGHYFDPPTGLHYNRFRYYSPELGRYLESDPAGQSGGINLYAYPANPLVQVDLRGLHPDQNDASKAVDGSAKPDAETPKAKGEEAPKPVPLDEAVATVNKELDKMSKVEPKVFQVATHADGTVTVGISGSADEAAKRGQRLQEALPPNYKVQSSADTSGFDTNGLVDRDGKPFRGDSSTCAEPRTAEGIANNPSPVVEKSDPIWRAKNQDGTPKPNPYPKMNPDGTVDPTRMEPCPCCARNVT